MNTTESERKKLQYLDEQLPHIQESVERGLDEKAKNQLAHLMNVIRDIDYFELAEPLANETTQEQGELSPLETLVMRKARDIAEEIVKERIHDEEHLAYYTNEIKVYTKAKCKEQRELCAQNMPTRWETETIGHEDLEDIDGWIMNAPEPEL